MPGLRAFGRDVVGAEDGCGLCAGSGAAPSGSGLVSRLNGARSQGGQMVLTG